MNFYKRNVQTTWGAYPDWSVDRRYSCRISWTQNSCIESSRICSEHREQRARNGVASQDIDKTTAIAETTGPNSARINAKLRSHGRCEISDKANVVHIVVVWI